MISRLETVELTEVWKHEAKDFTPWLAENLDLLSDVIAGLELELVETERGVGDFSADIVCTGPAGRLVIIENQLTPTNHSHLGQILTYAVGLEAEVLIWIVKHARPEHAKVVSYIADNTNLDFYLLKVEAFKIGDSPAAPLLSLVAGPSDMGRVAGGIKKDISETAKLELKFWTELIPLSNVKNSLFANRSPLAQGWIGAGAGKMGLAWEYCIRSHYGRVQLLLVADSKDEADLGKARERYEKLLNKREEIEANYGRKLEWDFDNNRKGNYIKTTVKGGLRDPERWPQIQAEMVDQMDGLATALKPFIVKL